MDGLGLRSEDGGSALAFLDQVEHRGDIDASKYLRRGVWRGSYIENNWEKYPNGEAYLAFLQKGGFQTIRRADGRTQSPEDQARSNWERVRALDDRLSAERFGLEAEVAGEAAGTTGRAAAIAGREGGTVAGLRPADIGAEQPGAAGENLSRPGPVALVTLCCGTGGLSASVWGGATAYSALRTFNRTGGRAARGARGTT
jgi:hypothetical protein